jgi:hypothetical protein
VIIPCLFSALSALVAQQFCVVKFRICSLSSLLPSSNPTRIIQNVRVVFIHLSNQIQQEYEPRRKKGRGGGGRLFFKNDDEAFAKEIMGHLRDRIA